MLLVNVTGGWQNGGCAFVIFLHCCHTLQLQGDSVALSLGPVVGTLLARTLGQCDVKLNTIYLPLVSQSIHLLTILKGRMNSRVGFTLIAQAQRFQVGRADHCATELNGHTQY